MTPWETNMFLEMILDLLESSVISKYYSRKQDLKFFHVWKFGGFYSDQGFAFRFEQKWSIFGRFERCTKKLNKYFAFRIYFEILKCEDTFEPHCVG